MARYALQLLIEVRIKIIKNIMKMSQAVLPPNSTCVVDLTGFVHRLAYMPGPKGLNPRFITSKTTGEPTWGIVGTYNQLNTLAQLKPSRIIAFSDSSKNGFRQLLSEDYKQKSGSTYIGKQLARLAQSLPLMGIPVLGANEEFAGMEAEDVIAKAITKIKGNVVIISYDKDLLQLVGQANEHNEVYYYNPQRKVLIDRNVLPEYIRSTFKFPTKAPISGADLAVLLAVTGDDVDGVKAVGGVGTATLAKYYDQLPAGLTNLQKIEALAEIDRKTREATGQPVTANWKRALVNLEITDLRTTHQHNLNLPDTMPNCEVNKPAFRQVLDELTMNSFIQQYDTWFAPFEHVTPQPKDCTMSID